MKLQIISPALLNPSLLLQEIKCEHGNHRESHNGAGPRSHPADLSHQPPTELRHHLAEPFKNRFGDFGPPLCTTRFDRGGSLVGRGSDDRLNSWLARVG